MFFGVQLSGDPRLSGRFLGRFLFNEATADVWCPCSDSVHCHVGVCFSIPHMKFLNSEFSPGYLLLIFFEHGNYIHSLSYANLYQGVNIPTFRAQIDVAWFVWPVKSWWSLQKIYDFFRCILRLKHPYKIWDKKSMYTLIEASKNIEIHSLLTSPRFSQRCFNPLQSDIPDFRSPDTKPGACPWPKTSWRTSRFVQPVSIRFVSSNSDSRNTD